MRCVAFWLASLISACAGERLEVGLLDQKVIEQRLAKGLVSYDQREATVADLFREAGCTVQLQKVSGHSENVICTLPGESNDPIIVGGHYDFISKGQGIIDDWSGAAMLVSLYQSLKTHPRKHTFVFVAFAQEEVALNGSRKYVHSLSREQLSGIRAFVNLECLGTSPLKVWGSRATPELLQDLERIAATFKTSVPIVNVDKVGDDDSRPFLDAKVRVITLHSITQQTIAWLHTKLDRLDAIRIQDYYDSYKLIAFFLTYLDSIPR